MIVKILLRPEAAERIEKAILQYMEDCEGYCDEEVPCSPGYYDGVADFYGEGLCYTTGSGMGEYTLSGAPGEENVLYFRGRRNSFLDGTAIFRVEEEDVIDAEILESQQPERGIFEFPKMDEKG